MRRAGRVGTFTIAHFLPHLIHVYACITVTAGNDYGVPIEIKLWDTGRTPIAHMVDVTNEFGLKVLAEHNHLNDNNIAFSPYGLMGILVALYEGVDGESSYQIQRGIPLPWNRNIMRIGFRDIHRTLKTYFVPEEGFLAGLALNNENVTFNDNYKKVLRFYGFDLDNDQLPMLPPQANSTIEPNTVIPATNSTGTTGDGTITTIAMTTASKPREETTQTFVRDETTTNPNAETIGGVDVQASTVTITASPSLAPNSESTQLPPTTTTVQVAPSESAVADTTWQQMTTNTGTPSAETSSTNEQNELSTTESVTTTVSMPVTMGAETDGETISQQTSQATVALTVGVTANNEADNPISTSASTVQPTSIDSTTATPTSVAEENTQTDSLMTSSTAETEQTEQMSTTLAEMVTAPDASAAVVNESTLETLQRRKKSIVDFIFSNPPYMDDYLLYRSFDIPAEIPSAGFNDKMFLANGLKSVQVTYMQYDSLLEHAYLPHLEASAVRLPLDSDRYYLLVVLPTRGGAAELGRLLARMARESDLSDVYAALRPRRVRGIVPSFTVKGHVTLTTDLQKLGIRDVFEPRQRDFTPMTRQAGVYVRSIEQAVSVAIRKYRPDDHKKNRTKTQGQYSAIKQGYVTNREPVTFYATYPFLYFVMDASIHVSLMAGKMVDPLNSRIL